LDLLIKNGTIVTESQVVQADIGVDGGVVTHIGKDIRGPASRVLDAAGKLVLPGGIDAHTHFEMPFMGTCTADDFESGTIAAACGGITTIIDFAMQPKGNSLFDGLETWRRKADPKVCVDYGLHVVITEVNETTIYEIKRVVDYCVPSFKLYVPYRNEGLVLDDASIYRVMQEAAKCGGLVGLHCENEDLIQYFVSTLLKEGKTGAEYHPKAKPAIVEGEARHVGTVLASMAKEIEENARPFEAPCFLVAGGETTVTISGEAGEGGRNQELGLSAGMRIAGSKRIVIASVGTDGSDGPTDIAGAIVDGYTSDEARRSCMDLSERLRKHDSSNVSRKLRDAIYANDTGTNLMDLMIVYVGSDEPSRI